MENTNIEKTQKHKGTDMFIMFCDVFLFSSAVNCLFQMLAYGKTFDIILFIISLALGIFVYFKAMDSKKNPSGVKRMAIASSCVILLGLIIPLLDMILKK